MEEARLARLGKRKREPSPEPVLFNPGQGSPDAWQLDESAEDFVRRLPPLTTSIYTCAWIWAHNPHFDVHDKSKFTSHRADEFRSCGADLLGQSLQTRQQMQSKGLHGPKAALTRSLNQESKDLQQRITDLAVECGILSGKVRMTLTFASVHLQNADFKPSGCSFPNWRKWLVYGKRLSKAWSTTVLVLQPRWLQTKVNLATDSSASTPKWVVCAWTALQDILTWLQDFRDEDDVLRVLSELETMGLVNTGRSIYYKSDAFTYLDLYKQTASDYGLQASLYTSFKMMAAAKVAKATSSSGKTASRKILSGKKPSTLNGYF
jgi:hypothetical protein